MLLRKQPERPSSAAVSTSSPPPAASASPVQTPQMDFPGNYFTPPQLRPLPPRQCPPNTAGGNPPDSAGGNPPDSAGKRLGIPPLPPPPSGAAARSPSSAAAASPPPFHSRYLSQPPFFSLDNLPHLTLPPTPPAHAPIDAPPPPPLPRTPTGRAPGDGLPPRKAHRRLHSDIPFSGSVFLRPPSPVMATTPPLPQRLRPQLVKQEEKVPERSGGTEVTGDGSSDGGEYGDDLINAYMNWDGLDSLNSSGAEEKQQEDLDSSRMTGTRTKNAADSSENEAESISPIESGASAESELKGGGHKRLAAGDLKPMSSRHARCLSVDSLMSKLHFGDETLKFPSSPGNQTGQHSRSIDITMSAFSSGSRSSEFSSAEMKKIMANEKLSEMKSADPKKVKRILANRQSAARSKERKMRYISELEHKVQTLQTEATTLSAQLTLLQRDSVGLTSENNELKFRIQAMEQQAQLRDALHQALTSEVRRLKLVAGETSQSKVTNSLSEQIPANAQMLQSPQLHLPSQQSSQLPPLYQSQSPPELQQQQQSTAVAISVPNPESKHMMMEI